MLVTFGSTVHTPKYYIHTHLPHIKGILSIKDERLMRMGPVWLSEIHTWIILLGVLDMERVREMWEGESSTYGLMRCSTWRHPRRSRAAGCTRPWPGGACHCLLTNPSFLQDAIKLTRISIPSSQSAPSVEPLLRTSRGLRRGRGLYGRRQRWKERGWRRRSSL